MKRIISAALALGLAISAQADLIVPDGSVTVIAGTGQNSDASRYIESSMFDGDNSTFYAMGLGGSVQIDLDAPNYFTGEATFIEVTWNNGGEKNHSEASEVWWGIDGTATELAGVCVNFDTDDLSKFDDGYTYKDMVINPTMDTNDDMTWNIAVPNGGPYNMLLIKDVTEVALTGTNSFDGFDVGEISYAVPEPTTVSLLGFSMLALFGMAVRRKK